ncbi:MAG: hypothetical protein ACTSVV_10740 [Promethearchaeota archaeon]
MNKPLIICGSGNSIPFLNSRYFHNHFKHGLDMNLETIIKGNYSIGLNYFWKYGCPTTFNSFADWQFYKDNHKTLKELPLIIGSHDPSLKSHKRDITHDNTILLKNSGKYNGKESINKGVFNKQLIGIWSLSLAIALGFKEIYLLGYDCCEINCQTHFYQGVVNLKKATPIYMKGKLVDSRPYFRGIGKHENGKYKTSTYNVKKHLNEKWFAPFQAERKEIKIYNVSSNSAINVFPKINYIDFYQMVENNHIDQTKAREEIRQIIQEKLK